MTISSGTVLAAVNRGVSPSNSVFSVTGTSSASGGTVKVQNTGPTLQVGDKFTLFSAAVQNGSTLTVTGGGANWNNNLAVDGSISVTSIIVVTPPPLDFTRTGSGLQFSWTNSSFKLQAQTNSITVGIRTNWVDYPGGSTSPVILPIDPTKGMVFFRLVSTP
jgi:hypothetical protein